MKSILCNRGYVIQKNKYPEGIINNIKKDLNVKPFIRGCRSIKAETFNVYLENETKLSLPKFYALEKLGKPDKIDENKGININIDFKGLLRDYQEKIINIILPKIKDTGGGILSIPPGKGKTVLGIYLAYLLKKKTLVIVHKTFLVNQWKNRIQQYVPDAKVGIIQGDKIDIENKDIVIGMLQSISMKDYELDIFNDFGFIILDEVHHLGAKVFSKALQKTSAIYMLGLSATPFREDKLEKVIKWYIGDILYYEIPQINQEIKIRIYKYESDHKDYIEVYNKFTKEAQTPTMISNIVQIEDRNNKIVKLINDIKQENSERKILVLSGRLDHLNVLKNSIDKNKLYTTSKYIGGMKEKHLIEAENAEIIFSTYEMSSEGLDIPSLNTIIMATPRRHVEQSTGRILRKQKGSYLIQPLIIDIVDKLRSFTNQGYARKIYYRKITGSTNIEIYKLENNEFVLEKQKIQNIGKNGKENIFSDSDNENNEKLFESSDSESTCD